MKNTIVGALLILLSASVAFLLFQNYKLNKRLDELALKNAVSITPVAPASKAANPAGASPFDKPNIDPLADQFPPESAPAPAPTSIKFEKLFHDFGKINEDDVVRTVFKFTNTGKNPLVISRAQGSCGCTVPKWPQHPIKPGESDEIGVEFNSAGKRGENDKTVTVSANTSPSNIVLTIRATVVPKDK
jgi:hypothetical protein